MFGRKKVVRLEGIADQALQAAVNGLPNPERSRALKDLHIVSAALASDRVVLSCDVLARAAFAKLTMVGAVEDLLWANPENDAAAVLSWLERGAPAEVEFRLPHGTENV
jgi:hypothetical protein